MMQHFMRFATLVLLLCLLAACQPFAPDPRLGRPLPLPDGYDVSDHQAAQEPLDKAIGLWWRAFGSPELDALVQEALADSFSLRTARARLAQALATADKTGATLWPTMDINGSATGNRSYSQTTTDADFVYSDSERWKLGLAAGYELDLWGKLTAERQAAAKDALAARQDLEAAAMTLAAEVAENWVNLLATREAVGILEKQIEINEQQLRLHKLRFANGLASALDVSQQREVLARTRADMPLLLADEQLYANAVAYLMGRADAHGIEASGDGLPELPPLPETGLPARLLASRPDVRAARLRLEAADWDVAVARADRLPALNISAEAAYSSVTIGILFDNWVQQLAASLFLPVIDGGRRAAEVDRQRAVVEQRLAEYADTVATAVREVQDALVREDRQREYIRLLEQELEAADQARAQARLRYLQGQSDYLPLLTEVLNVQKLQLTLVRERAKRIVYRISLHRALGGGWTAELGPDGLPAATKYELTFGANHARD